MLEAKSTDPSAGEANDGGRAWAVEARQITRNFGGIAALAGVDLAVHPGEFFSLLGPSGCGKTTLLRLIAGLDLPDGGAIRLGGREATQIPANLRPVNTVFQSYALFPHLDVWENVAFGLRMKRVGEDEIRGRVKAVLAMVDIEDLGRRRPSQLSGGQKQRVALARAIVNEPEVLLLDEPLGALDFQLRKQLQVELQRLQRRLGMTFIYVTHDQEEALAMSDRIAVMRKGRIEQLGEPKPLYDFPRTRFVAQFLGSCNIVTGKAMGHAGGALKIETPQGILAASTARAGAQTAAGATMSAAIRPEKVRIWPQECKRSNTIQARLESWTFQGAETEYTFSAGDLVVKSRILSDQAGFGPVAGGQWQLELPLENLIVVEE